MYTVTSDNYFDAARALHWYCSHYHHGGSNCLYRVMSELNYTPSLSENDVNPDDESQVFYDGLEQRDIDPEVLLKEIQLIHSQNEG